MPKTLSTNGKVLTLKVNKTTYLMPVGKGKSGTVPTKRND